MAAPAAGAESMDPWSSQAENERGEVGERRVSGASGIKGSADLRRHWADHQSSQSTGKVTRIWSEQTPERPARAFSHSQETADSPGASLGKHGA